jgi:hypothetical protein
MALSDLSKPQLRASVTRNSMGSNVVEIREEFLSQSFNPPTENAYYQKVFGDCHLAAMILFRPSCMPM